MTEYTQTDRLSAVKSGAVGFVHSWEIVTAVDGPGTRMTVFLSGCPLRCLYCHNPDTLQMKDGKPYTLEEMMEKISRYKSVFKATGGGITFSGGEALMQPKFVERVFAAAKEMGVHTCLDTSGFLGTNASDELLANTDMVLLDVKSGDEETYARVTGAKLQPTIDFGHRLAEKGVKIWVRFVLVPGLTDAVENVENIAKIVSGFGEVVERVEILPFHQLGRDKWHELGLNYQLEDTEPPTKDLLDRVRTQFREYGLTVY